MKARDEKRAGREFWDANPCGGEWASYEEFCDWLATAEPYLFGLLRSEDWSGRRVLEVGCGQGAALHFLPGAGATRVVGLDASYESLSRASAGARSADAAGIQLLQGDAEHLPCPDGSFDAVLSIGVLHHTPDTAGAIREIHRVLRPGGRAVVMLYRSGNPKWWATRALRGVSALTSRVTGRPDYIVSRLRGSRQVGSPAGTALLELFGCPTLKAFSNRQVRRMFADFGAVSIENVQPGFERMADILPLGWARPVLRGVDRAARRPWGFYQVIRADRAR